MVKLYHPEREPLILADGCDPSVYLRRGWSLTPPPPKAEAQPEADDEPARRGPGRPRKN